MTLLTPHTATGRLFLISPIVVAMLLAMTLGLGRHVQDLEEKQLQAAPCAESVTAGDELAPALGAQLEGPTKGQKRPPCKVRGAKGLPEVELKGACWWKVAEAAPPCEEGYDFQGACYLPVPERFKVPSTIQR